MSAAAFDPFADVVVGIDLADAYVDLQVFEQTANEVRASVVQNIRIAGQTAIFMATAIGGTLSAIYGMMLEGVLLGLEVALAVQGGTFGLANMAQLGQIIFMAQAIRLIKQKKTAQATQTQQLVGTLRLASNIRM